MFKACSLDYWYSLSGRNSLRIDFYDRRHRPRHRLDAALGDRVKTEQTVSATLSALRLGTLAKEAIPRVRVITTE